jgi:hypothetical protein
MYLELNMQLSATQLLEGPCYNCKTAGFGMIARDGLLGRAPDKAPIIQYR